jgi:serine/threonine protein kinase
MSASSQNDTSKTLADLELIQRDGQFGASFRTKIQKLIPASRGPRIERFLPVPLGPEAIDPAAEGSSVFIKCPERSWNAEGQQLFVDSEYNCGTSINHARDRMQELFVTKMQWVSDSKPVFTIAKLLGKGWLRQDSSDKGQPCLVFEDAGVPTLEQLPLTDVTMTDLLDFAEALAQAIRIVHNQGIVHTFLVPRHLVQKQGAQPASGLAGNWSLVGFGYARHSDSPQKDLAPPLGDAKDRLYLAPECRERSKSSAPHTVFGYPADIYSIGAILYGILIRVLRGYCGETGDFYRDPAWDILEHPTADHRILKRDIRHHLIRLAHKSKPGKVLLDGNENILKILDSCLRYAPSDRFSYAEDLVEAIEIARIAQNTPQSEASRDNDTYFSKLLRRAELKSHANQDAIKNGHLEVHTRDGIVTSLCQLLADAPPDSVYRTLTLPDYWTDGNLGSNGRFLIMNRHMAKVHKLRIERLFLVSDVPFHMLPEETQRILESHLEASRGCEKTFIVKVKRDRNDAKSGAFERNGKLVAYLSPSGLTEKDTQSDDDERAKKAVCLNFFSLASEARMNGSVRVLRQITKLRYWNPFLVNRKRQFLDAVEQFEAEWKDADRLEAYIKESSDGHFFEKDRGGTDVLETLIGGPGVRRDYI